MIIGCDYSTKFVHLAWKTISWEFPRITVEEDLGEFLYGLNEMIPYPHGGDGRLYIERPWSRYNPGTAMALQRIATIVDVVATQAGYETHWIPIAAWRSKIFGKGKYPSKIAKEMAKAHVKKTCGLDVDDNTADAICLALYGEIQ